VNYFEAPGMSASAIKVGAISMLAMHDYITNGRDKTASMRRGTIQHLAVLEPAKLGMLVESELDGRSTAGKALIAQHGRENIVKIGEKRDALKARSMVLAHREVKRLQLFSDGEAEKEIFWTDNGIAAKCKVDYITDKFFVEYKTTSTLAGFSRSAAQMNYQLQLGWYYRGCKRKCFVVAQEQKSPWDVAVFEVPRHKLEAWGEKALEIAQRYQSGDRSGAFPELMIFELPDWCEDSASMSVDDLEF